MPHDPESLAALLERADGGDVAARDGVFSVLYAELHRLAQAQLRRTGDLSLGTTTLVHEAYLDLSKREPFAFPDKGRFMAYAARAMRGLIIDHVRRRSADKRGGGNARMPLEDVLPSLASEASEDLPLVGEALDRLADLEPPLAELVDLKFFCGFSFVEIAAVRGVSERTVQRDWAKARLLLRRLIDDSAPPARSG